MAPTYHNTGSFKILGVRVDALLPEIERQQKLGKEVVLRADAAFAKPEIYEALEERGVKYAMRIPSNDRLERDIAELLTRRVGRKVHNGNSGKKGKSWLKLVGDSLPRR